MSPAKSDQEETVDADLETGEDMKLPLQEGGDLDDLMLRAHEVGGRGHGGEDDADGEKDLVQGVGIVKANVEGAFQNHPGQRRNDKGCGQADQKRHAPSVQHHDRDIAAQHGEGTMGQIDEVHDAQGDAEPEGQQEQQGPIGNPVKKDCQHRISLTSRTDLYMPAGGTEAIWSNSTLNRCPPWRFTSRK